ncbi:hypothetical protein [Brunnivagina elsteri]|uniref:Uncharacterized protein n=1 Tax=Brunnivagina elsteri CCALA 953 TaxID=987040 RepID=A0A2A2TN16_9CYAN|nr:hypothetical protein [Calothrix elsteri]PAX59744.1 hypothetical protein CK510_05580 [Calothrix elsteri CCALA 953]
MVDRINDIFWQAQQGSVAAIIQVLNERLADSGVRTRAVFDNSVLQLLCEANTEEQLERTILVEKIHQILKSIAPRNIHRVNINCRIVREQQLLWLEEIYRDSENQLLWSEEIVLEKLSFLQQFIKDLQDRRIESARSHSPKVSPSHPIVITNRNNPKSSVWGWILLAASICILFGMMGTALYVLVGDRFKNAPSLVPLTKSLETQGTNQLQPEKSSVDTNQSSTTGNQDYFVNAVRIANEASGIGQKAKTSTQWLELAANWQRASDLMGKVPPSHSRYQEAQIRTKLYRQYSQAAQKKAEESKS